MGSGDLDALIAELKGAQADLAVIHRQLEASRKNVIEKNDFGAKTDIHDLWDAANKLERLIDYLSGQIRVAKPADDLFQGLPPSDPTFAFTTVIQSEPDPKKPDVVDQPSLPPTEVFNSGQSPVVDDEVPFHQPDPSDLPTNLVDEVPFHQPDASDLPTNLVDEVPFHQPDASDLPTNLVDETEPEGNGRQVVRSHSQSAERWNVADGDLNALLAEREQAEADLAVIMRQIEVTKKNIAEGKDFGASDIRELTNEAADLGYRIRDLNRQIVAATPPGMLFEGSPAAPPIPSTAPVPPDPDSGGHQPPVGGSNGAFEVASETETAPAETAGGGNGRRIAIIFGLVVLTLVGAGAGIAVLGSKPAPSPTVPPTATATAPAATRTTAPTLAPTLPPVVAGPIRYASECNGDCFMEVDPATCDRTFHFVLALLGDAATAYEGKTAIISTRGPGLQPTYEVPVTNGKVVLDAVAKGSDYGGNPNAGCGANASWTGLLTSVDGKPTTTPDAPE